ncbi:MAG: phytoene dehydrogenase-like oxidoreductase [Acidobacteriaceae bacterium]|nr:phytoene dehydrogenase-like oxidoreductase [Acidobacteriaceae bacterium]
MTAMTRRGFVKGAALAPVALKTFGLGQQTPSTDRFDVVVAGAGHNSLIAAAYLAKAGFRCIVLEGRPILGGGVKTAELTLKGFLHDTCSSAHTALFDNPLIREDELKLGDYGLEYIQPDPVFHMPFPDGTYLTQWRDIDRTCAEFAKFSKKDGAAYRRMLTEYESVKPFLEATTFSPIGFAKPLNDRLAEHPKGKLWQRRLAMSAWQIIRDNFEDDHCRSFMLASPWSNQPPDHPVTGRSAYSSFNQQRWSRPLPKGGSGQLSEALARYIEAHGGVVLPNKPVVRLIIESGKCTGVECEDGSLYRAQKAVLSTIHIKQLVDMAPRELWTQDFVDGVDSWQAECSMIATNYATTEPPKYAVSGGTLSPVHSGLMASPERALRFGYDYARGAVNLDDPPLHIICCTIADPTRAPQGMHTVKVVGYQPYDLKEGPQHWDAIKDHVAEASLRYLRRFSPSLTDEKILARVVDSPLDLERMNPHNWHGSCHAGAWGPSQSGNMRPVPGWAQHRMPIPGLYQTGATTFPGGSVTGAPGRNAATVMLKDFGTSIDQVVGKKS